MQSKEDVKQQMFIKIIQWQQSGVTQKAFCQQNDIAYHVFHYYYGRFRSKNNDQASTSCRCWLAFENTCYNGTPLLRLRPTAEALTIKEGCVY